MISTKFVSSAAALALIAALNAPTASFAWKGGGGGGHWSGGGGVHFSGAPAAHFSAAPAARFVGAAPAGGGVAWRGGPTAWNGGNGAWHGGFHHHRFFPGAFAAGAALGAYAAYGGPDYYYDPSYGGTYYDNGYYDDGSGVVAVVPVAPGGGDPAACAQTYRSYDPASGTYLGYDGLRHPCP
jgi:hypothetical protein